MSLFPLHPVVVLVATFAWVGGISILAKRLFPRVIRNKPQLLFVSTLLGIATAILTPEGVLSPGAGGLMVVGWTAAGVALVGIHDTMEFAALHPIAGFLAVLLVGWSAWFWIQEAHFASIVADAERAFVAYDKLQAVAVEFKTDYSDRQWYSMPGILAPNCADMQTGCFSWAAFPKVVNLLTSGLGRSGRNNALITKDRCRSSDFCELDETRGAYISYLDNAEYRSLRESYDTRKECVEVGEARGVLPWGMHRVRYCSSLTAFWNTGQITLASFTLEVEAPPSFPVSYPWRPARFVHFDFGRNTAAADGTITRELGLQGCSKADSIGRRSTPSSC